jgi:sulfopyruvate decarboxylase alpha subunit
LIPVIIADDCGNEVHMHDVTTAQAAAQTVDWPEAIYRIFKKSDIRQVSFVPDGGHAALIRRVQADDAIRAVSLTTEEEGVALAAGAWLGDERHALLMQSSGVGNCINMLSLIKVCKFPFLTLVTMRGEWGEFNPWQVPMGSATQAAFELMGVQVLRADHPRDVEDVVQAAANMAFGGGIAVAVLLSQRLIGAKNFAEK